MVIVITPMKQLRVISVSLEELLLQAIRCKLQGSGNESKQKRIKEGMIEVDYCIIL